MKFKIDENLPIEIAELLREAGYDAMTVEEQNMSSADRPQSHVSLSTRTAYFGDL